VLGLSAVLGCRSWWRSCAWRRRVVPDVGLRLDRNPRPGRRGSHTPMVGLAGADRQGLRPHPAGQAPRPRQLLAMADLWMLGRARGGCWPQRPSSTSWHWACRWGSPSAAAVCGWRSGCRRPGAAHPRVRARPAHRALEPYLPLTWWVLFLLAIWSVVDDDLALWPVAVVAAASARRPTSPTSSRRGLLATARRWPCGTRSGAVCRCGGCSPGAAPRLASCVLWIPDRRAAPGRAGNISSSTGP